MVEDDPILHSSSAVAGMSAKTLQKAIRSFVKSMLKKTGCNVQVLLTAAVYLQRVRASNLYFLTPSSFCILCTVCLYLASKFLHDKVYSVKYWAECSGFTTVDILAAEQQLLRILQFELFVSSDSLLQFLLRWTPRAPVTGGAACQ